MDESELDSVYSHPDFLEEDTSIEDEETFMGSGFKSMSYLNNVDYSLNSPLGLDETREFAKYCAGKGYENRWNYNLWKKRKDWFKIERSLIDPVDNHKWWARLNSSKQIDLRGIRSLIGKTVKDADETFIICQAFFKGWLGTKVTNPKTEDIPDEILKWGALFLEFHLLVLILNAQGSNSIEELSKLVQTLSADPKDPCNRQFLLPNLGIIKVSRGFAYLFKHNVIVDRSFILMMKDTSSARFHSLYSMIHRTDQKFKPKDWQYLEALYKIGDNILSELGNEGYKCIKMLEPICNWKLTELAQKHRPLIRLYTPFRDYVEGKISELELMTPKMRAFFNHVMSIESVDVILNIYGSFRHWGHPYINALEGIRKLNKRVTEEIVIDEGYANCLASDFAYKVLHMKFKETSKWMVDINSVESTHVFYPHIEHGTWPTPKQIQDFGDHWHELPLTRCFDIPDVIDPSQIYADKSHSMNKQEVLDYVRSGNKAPIPTRKVLDTFINKPATNWPEFFQKIESGGLDEDSLIIGLKEKEREMNSDGRFFSLMSWDLREYFVITEYLIKTFYLPMFDGLTMADDLGTLTKKLVDRTSGQGIDNYEYVTLANHLDYEKWNNYQQGKANVPLFLVMGKFLGYPNLIAYTYEAFEKCTVYYNQRPDLMKVVNNELKNLTDTIVCWIGQLGGFEGIRQKGWSILNELSIERECRNKNTRVSVLAQGDNQVICTNYKTQYYRSEEELRVSLERIRANNDEIMKAIRIGATKLGLRINEDETMQSADYLNYGKIPVYRGNIKALESKRWSRCACVTNDQLPSLGNIISTVSSNTLTIAHNSTSPVNAIVHYNFIGNLIRNLLDAYNPAMRCSANSLISKMSDDQYLAYTIGALYLDPSLGGVSGMSLTRFLIRMFPDPVTEGLAFWKLIYNNVGDKLKKLCIMYGNPRIADLTVDNFSKLLENPVSLNLKNSVSAVSEIKKVIRKELYEKGTQIPNQIVRGAILFSMSQNSLINNFLMQVLPCFPRFLSEFKSATYLGITESIIGLFENSKTIRKVFHNKMSKQIDQIIVTSERQSITSLSPSKWVHTYHLIWDCSSTHADILRNTSWGIKIVGATIPHPIELIKVADCRGVFCGDCKLHDYYSGHLTTLVPKGLYEYEYCRGSYMAYLGSRTSETTSIIHPWERETKLPVLSRACRLRNAIHWFIEPGSNLANSVFSILEGLTGEQWDVGTTGFKRTGCGPHRYSSSRQSAGGYSAQSPSKLSRMITTTDTLGSINEENYDFMYQSLIIFSQATISELHDGLITQGVYHSHINCRNCLRRVEDVKLTSNLEYKHPNVSEALEGWKPTNTPWSENKFVPHIREGNWEVLAEEEKSYHIGRVQGFVYGDSLLSHIHYSDKSALFPLSLASKVHPRAFLEGLLDGLLRIGSLHSLSRRSVIELIKPRATLVGMTLYLIESISLESEVINMWRNNNFIMEFSRLPHRIPASYPLSNFDLGLLGRYYLKSCFKRWCIINDTYSSEYENLWVFSDVNDSRLVGSMALSTTVSRVLYRKSILTYHLDVLRRNKEVLQNVRDPMMNFDVNTLVSHRTMFRVDREVRHAAKDLIGPVMIYNQALIDWTREAYGNIYSHTVNYISYERYLDRPMNVPRYQDPLISGMRTHQCASGAPYKVRSIVIRENIIYHDILSAGDGSGGIGSWLLRNSEDSRLIFNSLLDLDQVNLKGSSPSGPSAIELIPEISHRCVNLRESWKHPNDLREQSTWNYFREVKKEEKMHIDIVTMDMEVPTTNDAILIMNRIRDNIGKILEPRGCLIYKTYVGLILDPETSCLVKFGSLFDEVKVIWTEYTSSKSSEVYVLFRGANYDNVKTYPDILSLKEFLMGCPVFRSSEEEFARARGLMRINAMRGVPLRYQLDPFIDLTTLLISLGVETGVSGILCEMIKDPQRVQSKASTIFAIYITSINSLLHLTHGHKGRPSVPSDSSVRSVGVLSLGFFLWVALLTNKVELYKSVCHCIDTSFPFSWEFVYNQKHQASFLKISVSNKYQSQKNFHLDNEVSGIAQTFRILYRMFPRRTDNPDRATIDKILEDYDFSLRVNFFKMNCDLLDVIETPYLLRVMNRETRSDNIDRHYREQAYRS